LALFVRMDVIAEADESVWTSIPSFTRPADFKGSPFQVASPDLGVAVAEIGPLFCPAIRPSIELRAVDWFWQRVPARPLSVLPAVVWIRQQLLALPTAIPAVDWIW
jgi:hypothetical protein